MSDLYRIGDQWGDGTHPKIMDSMVDDGWLVPATVDDLNIEAAEQALKQFMPTVHTANGITRDATRATLRAALGGTDE